MLLYWCEKMEEINEMFECFVFCFFVSDIESLKINYGG